MPSKPRVVRRVLGIAVAQVVLQSPQIGALVGEVVSAAVPEHMGPDPAELGFPTGKPDNVVDGLAGQLGLKQPGQIGLPE